MNSDFNAQTEKYARCINASKRVRWDIDKDVIRGRDFELSDKFLPESISFAAELDFLNADEQRLLSQIQGRTYANMFGLVERFINTKVLELTADYCHGDQIALEALVRFSDEELKHQELFRRVEKMIGDKMPPGYRFVPEPNEVAQVVLSKSTWSVLALTLLIELFTQSHYRKSIDPEEHVSPLFKDIFLYHWKEESQHAILDELEFVRHNARITTAERDQGVDDLIELVGAVDGILQAQAHSDASYFLEVSGSSIYEEHKECLRHGILKAYRWQYILSGVELPKFRLVLQQMLNLTQHKRVTLALAPIAAAHDGTADIAA